LILEVRHSDELRAFVKKAHVANTVCSHCQMSLPTLVCTET